MGLDFHRSLFQIIFHLLVSERTYSDCENHLYFDVIERFLWIIYYVFAILAIAVVTICYNRCQRAFGGFKSKTPRVEDKPIVADTYDSTIQTSEGWAVVYHQNDELRTRANIQHRRLKKVISEISNKRVGPKKPLSKPIVKVSRWRRRKSNSKPSDGCIKMLLDTKQQLLDRLAALAEMYAEAVQQKKDLKCALSISENQLFQNNRDAQLNWIQWQAAQRTIAETTTKALKIKDRLTDKDYEGVDTSVDPLSVCSSAGHVDPASGGGRKRHDSAGSDTGSIRHRDLSGTGDAGVDVSADDTPSADGDSASIRNDTPNIRVQVTPSASPDRTVTTMRRAESLSPCRQHRGGDSTEHLGRAAVQYMRGPTPSRSPDRPDSDSGSACERLRSSFSPDRRVGVVCGMTKSADRRVATAAVYPERRGVHSPDRLAKAPDAVPIENAHDYRRHVVNSKCRPYTSPDRCRGDTTGPRRVAVVPECPRLHMGSRRVTSAERARVVNSPIRRSLYSLAGAQDSTEHRLRGARHW